MIQVISEVTLDVAQLNYFDAIVTKQYDRETRFLRVHLTSNGEPITVDSDSSAIINARRPDKTSKSFMGTVESDGSSVLVPIAYWMVEQDGTVCCDVSVVQNTGVLTTMSFELSVQEAMNSNNDDSVTDDDKYGVLVSLIAEVSSFKTAEQQRVEAEQQRVEAEQARESWKKDTAEEVSGWATTVKETLDNAKLEVKNLEDAIGSSAESADKAAAHLQATKEYFEQVRTITIGAQGWYATPEALKAAVPVGENGWWAVVGTTDTIWTWDGDTGAWKDSVQKADMSDFYTQAQVDALLKAQKLADHPVGSAFFTISDDDPAQLFGGTWMKIAEDRAIMGASTTHAAGSTAEAGLPNITGSLISTATSSGSGPFRGNSNSVTGHGALSITAAVNKSYCGYSRYDGQEYSIGFNAANSSPIYGSSNTVQPPAYYMNVWIRLP
nr:MAG TPA: baseplate protein [Bacteriophage sp.]